MLVMSKACSCSARRISRPPARCLASRTRNAFLDGKPLEPIWSSARSAVEREPEVRGSDALTRPTVSGDESS